MFATDAAKTLVAMKILLVVATPPLIAGATLLLAVVANPLVAECEASVFSTESSLARSVVAVTLAAKLLVVLSQLAVAALVVQLQLPKLRLLCLQLRLLILPLSLLRSEALLSAKL